MTLAVSLGRARPRAWVRPPLKHLPGLALAFAIAWVAEALGPALHMAPALPALAIGLAAGVWAGQAKAFAPGLALSAREVLRLGVVLMGAKVTWSAITALGWHALLVTLVGLAVALIVGFAVGRALGLTRSQAVVAGGAVAICGASAAMAISAVFPRTNSRDRDTAVIVALVTLIGTVAMLGLPLLASALGFAPHQAATLLGASLHEMAQVAGAGYGVSPEVGTEAVTIKLVRIACLAPIVLGVRAFTAREAAGDGCKPPLLPGFVLGFVALALIANFGLIPEGLKAPIGSASQACVLAAIAALGLRMSPSDLFRGGIAPVAAVGAATLALVGLATLSVALLG